VLSGYPEGVIFFMTSLAGCDHHPDTSTAPDTADVQAVSVSGSDGGYTFAVTIRSPDAGCERYADWWEVVDTSGALRHRRILDHSHTYEQPFTRTGSPVTVAAGEELYVRAHLSTGGYGATMQGTAASDFVAAISLDADFAASIEASEPQPGGCAF
jgi:hypothetical protein